MGKARERSGRQGRMNLRFSPRGGNPHHLPAGGSRVVTHIRQPTQATNACKAMRPSRSSIYASAPIEAAWPAEVAPSATTRLVEPMQRGPMLRNCTVIVSLCSLLAVPAFAETPETSKGARVASRAQQAAIRAAQIAALPCQAELQRFCSSVKPNDEQLVGCLRGHQTELSDICKATLRELQSKSALGAK